LALALLLVPALPAAASPPVPESQAFHYFLPTAPSDASALRGHGVLPPPDQSQTYVLQEGDNLADVAVEMGRDLDVMACVTPSSSSPLAELRPGQTIVVPGSQYLCHTVQAGETLESIALDYQVNANVIVETPWNELADAGEALAAGQRLLIFGGTRPEGSGPPARDATGQRESEPSAQDVQQALQAEPDQVAAVEEAAAPLEATLDAPVAGDAESASTAEPWPYGDGSFVWPVEGVISQGFSARHKALDIAVPYGTPVVAADNGVVKKAGYTTTAYGGRIIIDHNINYLTLYAHLSQVAVQEGDVVEKGQVIGFVGSTGNSTGPHLHFEVRDFGYLVNPLPLLEPR
jgi:murein DD-endopeptidase MepM/ murein hydrolase activator NlpD